MERDSVPASDARQPRLGGALVTPDLGDQRVVGRLVRVDAFVCRSPQLPLGQRVHLARGQAYRMIGVSGVVDQ
jgi:hypothetical protein